MQVNAAIGCRLEVLPADSAKQLKGVCAWRVKPVISAVPHFNSVELRLDRTDHVGSPNGRMSQDGYSAGVMNPIH